MCVRYRPRKKPSVRSLDAKKRFYDWVHFDRVNRCDRGYRDLAAMLLRRFARAKEKAKITSVRYQLRTEGLSNEMYSATNKDSFRAIAQSAFRLCLCPVITARTVYHGTLERPGLQVRGVIDDLSGAPGGCGAA